MLSQLQMYLEYPFVRSAILVGVLISLCTSLLGVILVLRRMSFIGDSLSHVAFSFQILAIVLGIIGDMYIVLPFTLLCTIWLLSGGSSKVSGDSDLAMISVSSLAIGYLIMNVFGSSTNMSADVCSSLFGSTSILTLKNHDIIICIAVAIITLLVFILFYNDIITVTFDDKFAKCKGMNVKRYNLMISVVIAFVIVLAMKLVGSLLITALVVFPSLISMRLFKSFKGVLVSSVIISVFCTLFGILLSVLKGTPVGSTIVFSDTLLYIVVLLLSKLRIVRAR